VLFHPDLLAQLSGRPETIVLPVVAYAERIRQYARNGVRPLNLRIELAACDIEIEPFFIEEADRYAPTQMDDAHWNAHARDVMIAGHVRSTDVLWTTNPKDFIAIGIPECQIYSID
jgi:predicted nucleic acid-binding protein